MIRQNLTLGDKSVLGGEVRVKKGGARGQAHVRGSLLTGKQRLQDSFISRTERVPYQEGEQKELEVLGVHLA